MRAEQIKIAGEPVMVNRGGIEVTLSITGLGALSSLGADVSSHHRAVAGARVPFRKLGSLFGNDSPHAGRPAAWIEPRGLLCHRKWSPATMAALHSARQAIHETGWSAAELREAALVVGTSRGNAAGWLGPWPGRRPFRLMSASNTIHSEPAAAISIEFGISGPNHVLASGCSAGLDAVGIAMMMIRSGVVTRALAVAVDLPLVPMLLDSYATSGLLGSRLDLDPYHPETSGFIPAEASAAMAIEVRPGNYPRLLHYSCNSDACDPVGVPADGGRTRELIARAVQLAGAPSALCPHATGTAAQARAEPAMFDQILGGASVHLLKPFTGHAIGASGLLESVILARFMTDRQLPPNRPGLHAPSGFDLPSSVTQANGHLFKMSHGMGGHNSLLVISPP